MKRENAIFVLKEILDNCRGLDGHYFELSPPFVSTTEAGGYQIIIHSALDKETKDQIQTILNKHHLDYRQGTMWKTKKGKTEPDTFIIFKPKQNDKI